MGISSNEMGINWRYQIKGINWRYQIMGYPRVMGINKWYQMYFGINEGYQEHIQMDLE